MDGTGREQDLGQPGGHPLPDEGRIDDVPETLRREKGAGDNLDSEDGTPTSAEGKQAVRNQSIVTPEDYAGSSESNG